MRVGDERRQDINLVDGVKGRNVVRTSLLGKGTVMSHERAQCTSHVPMTGMYSSTKDQLPIKHAERNKNAIRELCVCASLVNVLYFGGCTEWRLLLYIFIC
jgi:hypothetical protein